MKRFEIARIALELLHCGGARGNVFSFLEAWTGELWQFAAPQSINKAPIFFALTYR